MSELLDRISKLSPKRLALLAMDLQSKLDAVERQRTEPIAIIGMGCRVPGADDPEAFWRLLRDGVDAVREVPADRWDVDAHYDPDPDAPGTMSTRWGGFLEHVDRFDPRFFGIAPRDAVSMDPQHRLVLEVAWEALEDAGQSPLRLAGSRTGVFVGITASDYARRLGQADLQYLDNYVLTGTSLNFVAGRLSYVLGLQGPSMAVDTACSSSLVAVHLACQSLRSGESRMALAGGVNAILTPHGTIATSKARMLAHDGRCKTFDAAADGIVRGEGCGIVVLKRLSDALADRDRVLGLIRGSAVNQDGASGGLTVPNGLAQQALLRDALARSGVKPAEVDYVEAHGTGTSLGDPIEVRALAMVLGPGRDRGRPLKIGSVKTNLGHLESASGVVGLIKTVLALQHEEIPPHLHLKNLTPHIDWKSVPVVVPTTRTPWPASGGRRIAGVSSFGFSGTNAHVVLEEAPVFAEEPATVERPLHVLAVSAKTEGALQELVGRLSGHLAQRPELRLADVCFTANAGRGHFAHRLAVPAGSKEELSRRLAEWASGGESPSVIHGSAPGSERPKVAFLFTGQGSQYAGMGRSLFETQPTFRKALEQCEEILRGELARPLLEAVYPASGDEGLLGETAYTQPALFALEYALASLWRSWGIEPSWVMGHSVGEYAAACVAGVFTLEDGLKLIAERGRLMQALPVRGAMAAVFAGEEQVAQAIAPHRGDVSIAAVNGPASVVISGTAQGVGAVRTALDALGVRSRALDVSHAFHSALMDPVREEFSRAAESVVRSRPRLDLISNVTGRSAGLEVTEADYWWRHLRQPVRFREGMATLLEQGCAAFIEIGPLPTLVGMGQRCLPEGDRLWLPSLRRGRDDWSQIVESLGSLYVRGAEVNWEGFDRDYPRRKVALPTYPFQRERYWVEEPPPSPAERAPAGGGVRDLVYEVKWPERSRGVAAVRAEGAGLWLVLADEGGVGRDLARRLEERGESCELLYREDAEQVEAAVDRATKDGASLRGVVHLWGLDSRDTSLSSLRSFEEWGVGSAVSLVRALAAGNGRGTRLWLVTRGAQAVGGSVSSVSGAALWGLGRVIALEHAEMWGGLVDLDPAVSADAGDLLEELWGPDGEDQVALRGGTRHIARLERSGELKEEVRLSGEGSYLITGGLGGLGLGLARWMVGRGARRLFLVGRSEAGAHAREVVRELEGRGARVQVLTGDVADAERMKWVVGEAGREAPLKGIVHAAGVMEPCAVAEMSLDQMRAVLRPKVLGGWVLHELSERLELDFFLTYSSAAGVWGSQGAGHYAAANHFLDALVSYRRGKGLPGLSVSWGPWGGGGMATEESQQWLAQMGVGALSPEEGLEALGRLLGTGAGQATVAAVDWRLFRPVYEARANRRLLERIDLSTAKPRRRDESSAEEKAALHKALAGADSARRRVALVAYLRRQVARVLGLSDAQLVEVERPLTEIGLDSLMATQLKNRVEADLEADVAVASFLTGPSIAELAQLIDELRSARDAAGTALLRPVPRNIDLPLSFAQQRLWFLDQMDAGSAYTLTWAARLAGPLDIAALEASLDAVVQRHEALRTVFPAVEGRPTQVVQSGLRIPLSRVDLGGHAEEARVGAASQWATEEARRPFDLARGPLLRASLLSLGENDHALVLTLHHIVTDGWSMEVLVGELAVLYEAFTRGAPSPLPELRIQYADFAHWQRKWLQGQVLEDQLSHWRRRLAGRLPVLELPTDRPRPPMRTYRGAAHAIVFPRGVAGALHSLGQRQGATLFMTLVAGLQALLHRYTGQDDVVIGFSVASRNRAELEPLIGFFVNNLVLRTDLSGNPRFRELLARVKERALEAYDHQDLPFEKLVEELHPDRDLAQNPIFQVMLDVQNAARKELRLSGLTLTPIEMETRAARFDLDIHVWESGDDLAAVFHYNTDLFDAETIARMAVHYQTLLEGAADDVERRLSELPLLTAAELSQVVVEWNATGRDYPREASLAALFEAQVERTPEAMAVAFEGKVLTYRELDREANRLANHLVSLGVGPEVRVGICVERSLEMVVGLLGILKAGGAYVPLDPSYPEDRLAFMLADADVPVLLTQARLSAALPAHGARVIHLDAEDGAIARSSDTNPGIVVSPDTLAYVIYTSGSTGRPKGAMNTQAGICNRLFWMQEEYGLTESDRVLQKTPFSFDVSVWEFFWPLTVGARLVVAKPGGHQDPAYLARLVKDEGITTIHFVPSMLRAFLEEPAVTDLKSVRRVICSGEALPYDLQERFFARTLAPLHNLYGPTEAAVDVTRWACRRGDQRQVVPIGAPIANTQAYVLDARMRPVPQGVTGELFLGGVQVGRGYHNRPDLTAEKFVPNPFSNEPGQRLYRTGDLVRHLVDGQIEFLGRLDHQVKVRGFRIELGEIESVLIQHPGVRDAVLLARTDERGDARLVAYVVPVAGTSVPAGELRQHAQERLPPYMVPASFVLLEELPLGPSGKVDRRALPTPEDVGVARETPFVAPRTPIEEGVAEIWGQILRVDRIGVHDSFFERGGHSLLVTQLVSRLLKTFDVELPLRVVFQTPTVAELAARIEASRRGTSMPPLVPVSRDAELTQSFAQQRLWFLEQLQPGSSAYNVSTAVFLAGELDKDALRLSLQSIVDRHESLRTTFATVDGRPLQVVAPAMAVALAEVDLRGLPDPAGQARRRAEEEASRPFDLARGPLLRATLLRLAEQEHALLLTVHHIVFDAWSMGILAREQALLYAAHVSGEPGPLRPLDVQYADFAAWQRDWLQGEVLEKQLGYWREQLEGLQALELPMDHARPAVQTFNGAWRQRTLPLLEEVRQLGRREGTTLFMTLLAAFQALLHRYTGLDDVAVGSPIANRPRVELEALVGLFVNSLVLRTDLSGDPTFRDLLARVKEVALGAYDHQDVPFERLVEEVGGQRDLGRNPLFQVMFTLHGTAVEPVALPGLQARPLEIATTPTHVDLELHVHESAGVLAATVVYNRDLFEAATIDRMLGHFQVLLEAIVARPDARLSELPLLTSPERQHTLVDWNDTRREYPREAGIHELFEAQAGRTPDAIAVSFDGEELSYGELNARGNRLARHLGRHGVGLEVRVGICMDRSVEMVVGLLGILKAGAAYVPLDPSYPKERLAFMIEDSRVPVLLAQERMLEVLPEYAGRVTCLDRDAETIAAESDASIASGAGGQSLAYVIYTSGSTGIPKGAAISHRAVNRLVVNTDYVQVQPSDRVAQASNASFDAATFEIWGALLNGARLVGISRQVTLSPRDLTAELERSGITILFLTTALFNQVVRQDARAFSSLRVLLFGGEKVDPASVRQLLGAGAPERLLHVYGPTETTTFATWHMGAQVAEDAITVPIGRPIANTSAYVLDCALYPVPIGVPGELCLGGDGLARGYLGRPELTAEKFVPNPFSTEAGARLYRTGDLVRYRADGAIEFLGRVDHQVKLRGYRIELGEIDAVLREDPAVKDSLAVMREDAPGEKRLVAYVVLAEGVRAEAAELRGFLKERLPEYMVPAAFVFLDTLPLTPNGKVDRRALPLPEVSAVGDAYEGPRTSFEEVLARIWSQVLRVEVVGIRDNFFELGGDSILSLQVMARANEAGLRFSLKQLFQHQTVAELALVAGTAAEVEAEQGPVTGAVSLTPVQSWFFEQEMESPHHFNQAVLLELLREVPSSVLESVVTALESHHDALRMRFEKRPSGWEPRCGGASPEVSFRQVSLVGLDETQQKRSIERLADEAQQSLDLARGPLWRVILFELGEGRPPRLLALVHHLIVDGVSWRVLLEDLQTGCAQVSRGERVSLPRKTTSFQRWAARLAEYAKRGDMDGEIEYWRGVVEAPSERLPVDHVGGQERNTVGTARTVSVVLGEAETRALLQEAPAAYRTQIGDLLLTALMESFAPWTGRDELLFELEGHGREELFDGVDLSRTVGWFTTIYPVRLSRVPGGPGEALKGVKEQLRRVPRRGIGYGLLRYLAGHELQSGAEVAFNYLGQFDQLPGENGLFTAAAESTGRLQSERARRTHLIEVRGLVVGGRLHVDWVYSDAVHERATVKALAMRFEASLLGLIEHCRSGAWGVTPSDFPLAKLDAASLERVVGGRREVEDIYPLAPMQDGMLLHTLMAPASGVYCEQGTFELEGALEAAALRRAWERVVERHGALRTRFVWDGLGRRLQVVERSVALPWDEEDWRGLPAEGQEGRFEELSKKDQDRGFELSHAPLMRLRLVRLGEEKHRLVWSFHHAVLDGWCLPLLMKEVLGLYQSYTRGVAAELGEVRPYRDYIRWLQDQEDEAAERYWRDALSGFTVPTPLVVDHPSRADVGTAEAGERAFALGEDTTKALKSLGRRHGLTLNTLVQGAWAVLLSRYSGERDVVFGVTVSGRPASLRGVETMVGLFINTLPLRVAVAGDQPALEWLKGLQAGQVEQRQWEHSPLAQVQKWSQVPAGQALFESLLVFENYPVDPALWAVALEPRVTSVRFKEKTNYALTLVAAAGPRLYLRFVYDRGRFEEEAVARLEGHLAQILEGLAADASRRVSELSLLAPTERQQLLVGWNETARDYARDAGIHELFEVQAAKTPEAIAVSFGGEAVSYGELNARANRLAHHLRRHGVGPEVRVGICVERSVQMVVGLLGILKAGGAYVSLDPSYPKERLAFMLEDSQAPVLVTQERMLEALPGHDARVVFLESGWGEVAAESDANPASGAGGQNLAYVIYTSGSTGLPKGVEVAHSGLVNLALWHSRLYDVAPGTRGTQVASPGFDASVWEVWPYLVSGASLHIPDDETRSSPGLLVSWLADQGITHSFLPTPLAEAVLKERGVEALTLTYLLTGGDKLHRVDTSRMPFRLVNHYGPTESTVVATCIEVGPAGDTDPPIGRPIWNTRTYVLDERMDPAPVGVAGELFIGGDGLARGYLNRPDQTAERFVPDPFSAEPGARLYRTGDLVRWLGDGSIEFLGRTDHQVKLRGFRIELGEVESVLWQHPDVKEAVVVAREDRPGDKRLVAYVIPRDGHGFEAGELRRHLQARLPDHMVPSAYVTLERLPLSPNGKVDRRALPAPDGQSHPDPSAVPPRNDLERDIAAIWREVLGVDEVGVNDNFFDLGGHSLALLDVHGKLRRDAAHRDLKVVDLFQYPTIGALAAHLSREEPVLSDAPRPARLGRQTAVGEEAVAIIGMAGRFPGARDVGEFWRNLHDGVESIRFFSNEELEAAGVPEAAYTQPGYVKARGVIEDADLFDATFFGYTAREAETMDPQQRVFLETASTALETAGYDPTRYPGRIGVYAGTSLNTYVYNLLSNPEAVRSLGGMAALISSDKDFLTTRVSYKLNLRGPSVSVQTACSTSLVAAHLACRSLIHGECDIALAGGVSIGVPQHAGYLYEEDGILSPDGHCRAFDGAARGTVGGSGVGIVVLKRLRDAVADGDVIHAVIRGSAINNDGAAKVGYTAPGIQGQAEVITAALEVAGIDPDTIGYVETHGTGTTLGDPIEVQALTQVFGSGGNRTAPCLIGSLKTNIGHLDAAAGVAGLIKTALALSHGQIPPSLHFEEPNPKIDFAGGPFRVNAQLSEWSPDETPRRAAVSSFGIGGTNAHVVLEEAPPLLVAEPSRRPWQLLVLSARTRGALDQATANLAAHVARHPEADLADTAYTLQVGRRAFRHRRIAVCRDGDDARRALDLQEPSRLFDGEAAGTTNRVAFLFPGQGAQHVGMGRGLYESEESFRADIDRGAAALRADLGFDLRDVLYPAEGKEAEASLRLDETAVAQPALFAFEYALARLWSAWGLQPEAFLGHSIGEYVAACLAGVFSLDDALSLVAARGRLMQDLPKGSMLAVSLPEEDVQPLLDGSLGLAATNGPSQCVISGPHEAVATLEGRLVARGVDCHRLRTSHAFHSPMMEPVLAAFRERVAGVKRQAPRLRYVSNLTGTWITDEQAVDPDYWARHLRETVRFDQGLGELLRDGSVLLEVGPGHGLSALARQPRNGGRPPVAIASARHARESRSDQEVLLTALGRVWCAGVEVDWAAFHADERRRRVALPTYPFERQRYWVEARTASAPAALASPTRPGKKVDLADWFYRPVWSSSRSTAESLPLVQESAAWMVFVDECGLGRHFLRHLERAGARVISVEAGDRFERRGKGEYAIRPAEAADHDALFAELRGEGALPQRIVHAWGVTARHAPPSAIDRAQDLGFHSLVFLAQALGNGELPGDVGIAVVTSGMQAVSGEGLASPEKATVLGACRVIPQEYAALRCRSIDVVVPESRVWRDDEIDRLLADCGDLRGDPVIAYRGGERWVQTFEPFRVDGRARGIALREKGVYLITGGLGGIGLELAAFLAESVQARLILVGRTAMLPREEWDARLRAQDETDVTGRRIRKLQAVEARGGEVLVLQADVSDREQMEQALARAESRFGPVHGVIHSAGVAPGGVIQLKTREMTERVLAPKMRGTLVLADLFANRPLDFMVLCSSLASVLGVPGQADYCAANAFQDAFARRRADAGGPFVVSVNWDTWLEAGMAVEGGAPRLLRARQEERLAAGDGILSAQGAEVFARALRQPLPQLVVSTVELAPRLAISRASNETPAAGAAEPRSRHRRPDLAAAYAPPRDEVEQIVAQLWQELLGFESVGVDDNFFDLGGHSLLATQMTNWLRQTFQVPLKLQDVFDGPTVAELARALARNESRLGQVREIARLALSVDGLSDSEVERMLEAPGASGLEEPRASEGYVR